MTSREELEFFKMVQQVSLSTLDPSARGKEAHKPLYICSASVSEHNVTLIGELLIIQGPML